MHLNIISWQNLELMSDSSRNPCGLTTEFSAIPKIIQCLHWAFPGSDITVLPITMALKLMLQKLATEIRGNLLYSLQLKITACVGDGDMICLLPTTPNWGYGMQRKGADHSCPLQEFWQFWVEGEKKTSCFFLLCLKLMYRLMQPKTTIWQGRNRLLFKPNWQVWGGGEKKPSSHLELVLVLLEQGEKLVWRTDGEALEKLCFCSLPSNFLFECELSVNSARRSRGGFCLLAIQVVRQEWNRLGDMLTYV